jgi:hypothetical protein
MKLADFWLVPALLVGCSSSRHVPPGLPAPEYEQPAMPADAPTSPTQAPGVPASSAPDTTANEASPVGSAGAAAE